MNRRDSRALDRLPPQTVRQTKGVARSRLREWARASGQILVEANLGVCTDRRSVLREIARAFALPSWFGMNLDALYDALTDLSERQPAGGYVIVLEQLPRGGEFGADERDALLEVFRDAAEHYAEQGVPFRVFYS